MREGLRVDGEFEEFCNVATSQFAGLIDARAAAMIGKTRMQNETYPEPKQVPG
jgi:hypothetical protein